MLAMEDSVSIAWARVGRGIASVEKAVTLAAASARTAARFLSGIRDPRRMVPGRIRLASGGLTARTRSADPNSPAASAVTVAPTPRYVESGNPAAVPAPVSTEISYPAWISFLHDSGTSATRSSRGALSFGTAIRIRDSGAAGEFGGLIFTRRGGGQAERDAREPAGSRARGHCTR